MRSAIRNGARINSMFPSLGIRLLGSGLAVLCATHLSHPLSGQTAAWQASANTLSTPAGTLVGIGTVPTSPLHVSGLYGWASSNWNVGTLARFSDGGTNHHSAILFDTGATGSTGIRGFRINKTSQDFFIERFDSAGTGSPVTDLAVVSNGNVGIGTNLPQAPLHVSGLGPFASYNWNVSTLARFSDGGLIHHSAILFDTGATGPTGIRGFRINKTSQDFFIERFDSAGTANPVTDLAVLSNGNVGIGTISPQNTLSVNGTVQAKEVIVNTGWSDYVFDPGHHLMPLRDVATYVEEHHHLPEIPSAAEVAEKGISLGEMQSKLLAKIEELTLHVIQADEENRHLRARVARIERGLDVK